jgi:hypothetical protein
MSHITQVEATKRDSAIVEAIRFLAPKRSPYPLIRVGGEGDGAYLVPQHLEGVAACFSPGVANRKDFEDELLTRFGILSHLMDFSSSEDKFSSPLVKGKQTFLKKWLLPDGSAESMSMSDWIMECEPEIRGDLLLQMDIEGAEYANLLSTPGELLQRFRVLVVEFHGLFDLIRAGGPKGLEAEEALWHVSRFFVSVHARANNCCGSGWAPGSGATEPEVFEVTFLRADECNNSRELVSPQVPHPHDIVRNVVENPPLHLSGSWRAAPLSFGSGAKVVTDWMSYFLYRFKVVSRLLVDRLYVKMPSRIKSLVALVRRGGGNK